MVGNYIDIGALENVNEGELKVQLDEAVNITIDSKLLDVFKNDLVNVASFKTGFPLTITVICKSGLISRKVEINNLSVTISPQLSVKWITFVGICLGI